MRCATRVLVAVACFWCSTSTADTKTILTLEELVARARKHARLTAEDHAIEAAHAQKKLAALWCGTADISTRRRVLWIPECSPFAVSARVWWPVVRSGGHPFGWNA